MTRVLFVQYANPGAYPPLVRGAQLLAERGCFVRVLGIDSPGTEELTFPRSSSIDVRTLAAPQQGWQLKVHYARYCAWVLWHVLRWRPNWIYASDAMSVPIALPLSYWRGVRVVYHEHDTPVARGALAKGAWIDRMRTDLARRAAIRVVPNAERARRFRYEVAGDRPVQVVWNTPRRSELLAPRARPLDVLRVVYVGSVVPARLPLRVLEAMASIEEPVHLTVIGYETLGSTGYSERLRRSAREHGIADQLAILKPATGDELVRTARECTLGLSLVSMESLDANLGTMTGASNKFFQYLAWGIVPLVSELPDWRELFVDPGYALACDPSDTGSIATALRFAASHPDELSRIAARGWQRIDDDWNYESHFAPVAQVIIGGRPTTPGSSARAVGGGRLPQRDTSPRALS